MEHVQRLESGDDDRLSILLGDEFVRCVADHHAHMARPQKTIELEFGRIEDRLDRRDDRDVIAEKGKVRNTLGLGTQHCHGRARHCRFEAQCEEHDLLVPIFLRDAQGIERRIDHADICALALGLQETLLGPRTIEREVIGERIRDKIAASKQKGMWMGGVPPLGYRVEDHRLSVIDSEAKIVRAIFRRYAELGSVRWLKEELEGQGIKSKSWTSASGRRIGDKPFSRGALYLILQNRTYLGEIVHKDQSHPGEHTPIIDQLLWDAAQAELAGNTAERNSGTRTRQPSLLAGMLFDANGNPMTPSHAVKQGTRYRYYVSRPLIIKDQTKSSAGLRIPAEEIEQLVPSRVRQWLLDPGSIYSATRLVDASAQRWLVARASELGNSWPGLPATRQRALLTVLIERIDVGTNRIDIHIRPTVLSALLDPAAALSPNATGGETQTLSVPVKLRRCGREIRMLVGTDPFATAKPNRRLIKLLIRARRFNAALAGSDGVPFAALAKQEGVSRSYFTRIVRLSYLAPDITRAILEGRQPRGLTADKLLVQSRLPPGLARSADRARLCSSRSRL